MRSETIDGTAVRHERIRVDGGVHLHAAIAGEGAPIVCLHGFPENWRSWRRQFGPLVRAGFSVWALDLRGYNESDRPSARRDYHLRRLVADVAAVVRSTGHPRAHIAGHDWGGVVAWTFAGVHPDLVDKLVILNAPHARIYFQKMWRTTQMFRSAYVFFFNIPFVAERALSALDFWAIRFMFKRLVGRPGTFSEHEVEEYVRALATPGALTAALNFYRANFLSRRAVRTAQSARIDAETLVIWGERDPALGTTLLDGLKEVAPRVRIHRIPDAGHFVQNEASEEVSQAMVQFLTA